ncbi:MAG: sigma-70 family RNA polymerase sigma factor [Thermoleophilaceae bacterium]
MGHRPEVGQLADGELMALTAAGRTDAFEAVYDRYRSQAFGMALRMTRRMGAAEEVTQEAFLGLWRSAGAYDPLRGSLLTWLLTLVRHRAIDALRRSSAHERSLPLDPTLAERVEAPERTDEQVAQGDARRRLRGLLAALPGEQRVAVELAYFRGLSNSEIATRLGVPLGTVKGRLRLALIKLGRSVERGSALGRGG